MEPGFESAASYPPLKPLKPMECLQRRSGIGGELGAFPCTMLMAVVSCCSHRPASPLITSMNVRFNRLANHAEGVQYAITSFADGAYGGACSVMIPNRSTRTCRARSEVKIFPRSWKIMAGLPKQGQECSHPLMPTR